MLRVFGAYFASLNLSFLACLSGGSPRAGTGVLVFPEFCEQCVKAGQFLVDGRPDPDCDFRGLRLWWWIYWDPGRFLKHRPSLEIKFFYPGDSCACQHLTLSPFFPEALWMALRKGRRRAAGT